MLKQLFLYFFTLTFFISCKQERKEMFLYVNANYSGIDFSNTITENDSINIIDFQYCYNGGGVGVGDFNNDGLSDLVFSGNQLSSKLYINKGLLKFQDISKQANFSTSSWVTGVSIVDINTDGWDDIYLSVGGSNCQNNCNNLLFINNGLNEDGIPTFTEQANAYNLDKGNYSQQAVFFDYDLDGDLDVYIVNNGNVKYSKNTPVPKKYIPNHLKDHLLRNDTLEGMSHPIFTNVSDSLGITHKGFGLGIALNDFNNDGWPDLYVSNDFITDDLLYINQRNDTITNKHKGFKELSQDWMPKESFNAMGVDVADVNNDALPDVLVLDMLPYDYTRQKTMLGAMNYDKYLLSQRSKYASQYVKNTLQLNNGFIDGKPLKTSEVSYLSGIASTDWSWAPLMADFDNDGDKDIYITNGYVKDITDLDFVSYSNNNNVFGTDEAREKELKKNIQKIEGVKLNNFFYKNNDLITFEDVSTAWLSKKDSYSNGAAYADLDNDGDLDVIVNNINDKAFIIKNQTTKNIKKNYIRLQLKGTQKNKHAIGAKITIWTNGIPQQQYQSVIRGYLSSVDPILHFGLESNKIDSLEIVWPNYESTKLYNVKANELLLIDVKSAKKYVKGNKKIPSVKFELDTTTLSFKHEENPGHDYVSQHLLMRQYNRFGPCVTAANIDGKIGDELFIGGSKGIASRILSQNEQGMYEVIQELESVQENTDAVFVDIDNDTDLDLYIANGGTEFKKGSESYQDQIYLNNGTGNFELAKNILPEIHTKKSIIEQ